MQFIDLTNKQQSFKRVLGLYFLWIVAFFSLSSVVSDSIIDVGICLAIFLAIPIWGHISMFPIFYKKGLIFEGIIWGSVSGLAISSLITAVVVYNWGWNISIIFISIFVVPCVLFIVLYMKKFRSNKYSRVPSIASNVVLPMALIIVTIFLYYPFKYLGILVGDKYLYAWLFGHDFIIRMVHVDSLSHGVPLQSYFFAGEKLSYYWLAYVYPALIHNISFIMLDTKQILQLTQVFYSILTVAALVLFINNFVKNKITLLISTILALCCYSYVGLYNIASTSYNLLADHTSVELFGYKADNFSGFSHSFYRFFLVEPQGTLAVAIIILILSLYEKDGSNYRYGILGIFVGILFGIEATNGIMLILWFLLTGAFAIYKQPNAKLIIVMKHIYAVLCASFIYGVLFLIQMYDFHTGSKALQLGANKLAILGGPIYFFIIYGPLLIFGIIGSVMYYKNDSKNNDSIRHYFNLLLIGIFFTYFIINPTEPHFGLFKATRILPICLIVLSVYYLDNLKISNNSILFIIVVMLLASPTLFTDISVASSISTPSTYVRHDDMTAALWIKNNLPGDAIVQAEPNYPESDRMIAPKYSYSLIPIFAERKTAIGEWKVSSQEHGKVADVSMRFHSIRRMYSTTDISECIEIIRKYGINYIYIGKLENELYKEGIIKFKNNYYFELTYYNNNVSVYKYKINHHES